MGQILLTQGTPDFIHFHSVFNIYIGWWFGTCLFSIVYGIILPIDFHIFQDGSNHQPENVSDLYGCFHSWSKNDGSVGRHEPGSLVSDAMGDCLTTTRTGIRQT